MAVKRTRVPNSPSLIFGARVLVLMLSLVTSPLIARAIGPEGRGETAAGLSLLAILPILVGLGVPLSVRRLISVHPELISRIYLSLRVGCVFLIVPAVAFGALAPHTLLLGISNEGATAVLVGSIAAPLYVIVLCDQSVFIVQHRYRAVALLQSSGQVINAIALVAFALTGRLSVSVVIYCYVASVVASAAVGQSLSKVPLVWRRGQWTVFREGSRYAASQLSEVASSRLDQVVVLPILGAFAAGNYSVALTIASIPLAVGHTIGAVYFPQIARCDGGERLELCARSVKHSYFLTLLAACGIAAVVPFLLPVVFGEAFREAVWPTAVALLGAPAGSATYVAVSAMGAIGRGAAMAICQLSGLVFTLVLLVVWSGYGAFGGAWAASAGSIAAMVTALALLRIHPRYLLFRRGDMRESFSAIIAGRGTT